MDFVIKRFVIRTIVRPDFWSGYPSGTCRKYDIPMCNFFDNKMIIFCVLERIFFLYVAKIRKNACSEMRVVKITNKN